MCINITDKKVRGSCDDMKASNLLTKELPHTQRGSWLSPFQQNKKESLGFFCHDYGFILASTNYSILPQNHAEVRLLILHHMTLFSSREAVVENKAKSLV